MALLCTQRNQAPLSHIHSIPTPFSPRLPSADTNTEPQKDSNDTSYSFGLYFLYKRLHTLRLCISLALPSWRGNYGQIRGYDTSLLIFFHQYLLFIIINPFCSTLHTVYAYTQNICRYLSLTRILAKRLACIVLKELIKRLSCNTVPSTFM